MSPPTNAHVKLNSEIKSKKSESKNSITYKTKSGNYIYYYKPEKMKLESLNLNNTDISYDGVNQLLQSNELKTLYLWKTNISNENQKDNNIKHQQLVSNEFKKLRSDVNKDLNSIVEGVKNTKVF